MSAPDRSGRSLRRRPRVVGPFTARWLGAVTVPLVVHDLSTGGCLVLSAMKKIPATHMTLEIDLPDRTTVTVDAEAIGMRSKGFAMRFVNVESPIQARLQRAIEALLARQST
jgi:hypothetical protein